ncbi:ABC transporter substrate-binding protein [Frankia sp. CNm7]|uniref:ABC transporter substrate-binding protein n=1 Tax=Frankia nepalensis TaxID=1836974 RepID=A0A937RR03_9ACTN|nr:ABC transporter substrate-binding protein [Frankia nepalensis]MBL7497619.1 ABC transporter substrate-binding protein [Frankia nepalensis]MBL7510947.1 ABC transporter substrate-binding protein [Frankia nepalensis]MBL7517939.1 ABC transporter substrate-binding protein [Frankia nepalensis]MBL7631088.1 ABC transporter substrate-binding protein [Frankia nepalensis]
MAVLVAGLAAGCSSDDDESPTPASSSGAAGLAAPVKIEHQFGTTTIESIPKRVVTLDQQWTDVMIAMGVTPVGYADDPGMPDGAAPWAKLPADAEKISVTDGLPIEQILALDPDLVVSTYMITDDATYQKLSPIVATIAGPPNDKVPAWQDLVRQAGEFLNQPEKAEKVIADAQAPVTQTAKDLPGLKDKTFALAQYIVGDSMYIVGDETDGSSVFFQQLGMKMFPAVVEESAKTGQVRVNVSTERVDLLRADLLAFLINGGDESDLTDIPGFNELPGTVAILDYATIVALNVPTPLSIPYALDALRPYLEKAAAGAGS